MTKVSVILSTYRGESYLGKTMDAVLSQTFTDFELIIVFQDCGDRTRGILSSYDDERIRIVETQPGYPHCMNVGIDNAKGDYIAVQDDDDIPVPDRLEKQVRYLDEHSDVIAVTSSISFIDGNGNDLGTIASLKDTKRMSSFEYLYCVDYFSANGTLMFRREATDQGLRYNESFYIGDALFALGLYYKRKAYHFKEPLVAVRRNVQSMMREMSIEERFRYIKVFKSNLRKSMNLPLTFYIRAMSSDNFHMSGEYWVAGYKRKSFKHLIFAILWNPLNWRIYRGLIRYLIFRRNLAPGASLEVSR